MVRKQLLSSFTKRWVFSSKELGASRSKGSSVRWKSNELMMKPSVRSYNGNYIGCDM